MTNLRVQVNRDLEKSMESESHWGLPVVLIAPGGEIIDTKKDSTDRLSGQVLLNYSEYNPDTGEDLVINDPIVTLRLSSLIREPKNGETWFVKIPKEPDPDAELFTYVLSPDKAMKFNRSIGFVRMYLQRADQS